MLDEDLVRRFLAFTDDNRFGLKDLGIFQTVFYADQVILDPNNIADTTTFEGPIRHTHGII